MTLALLARQSLQQGTVISQLGTVGSDKQVLVLYNRGAAVESLNDYQLFGATNNGTA